MNIKSEVVLVLHSYLLHDTRVERFVPVAKRV